MIAEIAKRSQSRTKEKVWGTKDYILKSVCVKGESIEEIKDLGVRI
jgi:hypothetical protein